MSRSVKDLRELICVSRLTVRESDDDEEFDLSRPLTSLSIYGERSADISGNGDHHQKIHATGFSSNNKTSDGFAIPRPPSNARGGQQRGRSADHPQSTKGKSLSDSSSFNLRKTPLPPVGGGGSSRPGSTSSSSSSGSDRPSSGDTSTTNFDNVLQYVTEASVTEWLQRTTQMLNELTLWCTAELDNFVDFAQFWLTEFPGYQRIELYKLELSIIADELVTAFGDAYREKKVCSSDISGIIAAVLKEYPTKLCSAQGPHIFLDILDTLTSPRLQTYKRLLTDTKASTRKSKYAQCLLALRAFTLVSVWSSIVHFYLKVTGDHQPAGAEGGEPRELKKPIEITEDTSRQRIFLAVQKGYVSVVHYFLRNSRVKPDVTDDQGRTLTFAAVLADQKNVLHFLITKHKDALPVDQPGESGNAPLHTAANWNYVEILKVLLQKGNADVNITNPHCDDATPLHLAVMQGHQEASKVLVSAGANVTASMNGITPLQLAADMGHTDIHRLLQLKSGTADYSEEAMDIVTDN